jgi:RimJ/RimL family protein N-acetyltransferase
MPSAPRLAGGLAERLGGDTRLKVARYVRRMETFEALRERALDRFEAPGPIETEGRRGVPGAVVPGGIVVMAEVALRETIDADLGTLFEFEADREASAMAAFPSRDLPAFLEREARIKADPSNVKRTIVAGGEVVGWIGSWEVQGERDVGFWIGRDHWGNGYATAALRAFLDIDLQRPLYAHVVDHNVGSRRVLEKCGFVLDHSAQEEDVLEHVLVLTG